MCDNVQSVPANRRNIDNPDMRQRDLHAMTESGARSPHPEDKIMQSDQLITHHPIPSRHNERTADNDGNGDAATSHGKER